ncbi:putative odorant receptor 85d [Diachasmimorpha longicaudata]|uniref:putative odorant receptor 85d n=1 Tax=Diachasmimorpha longicaudata TaxID=58733 RepID=UPI0030B8A4B8
MTPEFVIQWTKLSIWIVFTWPESSKSTPVGVIIQKIKWWSFWIFSVSQTMLSIYTTFNMRDSFGLFIRNAFNVFCLAQVVCRMVIGKYHHRRFQYLIEEMETFVKAANAHEREVFSSCLKRVFPLHVIYNLMAISATLSYILGPFTLDRLLPNNFVYPFAVDKHPTYDIMFVMESTGAMQCASSTAVICQVSLLLWYGTVQLELLAEKMKKVRNVQELKAYIHMHHHILWYIDEANKTVRPVVMTTIAMATMSILCGEITIIGNGPKVEKLQFIMIVIAYSIELLCVAWAAENLTTACEQVGWALYDSSWFQNSKELNSAALFVMQKCQNPSVVSIGGLVPKLSMNYYATYMSATYSFFTTLRVVFRKIENEL